MREERVEVFSPTKMKARTVYTYLVSELRLGMEKEKQFEENTWDEHKTRKQK